MRLSTTAQGLITKLRAHYGLSQTALFEFLLREEDRRISQVPPTRFTLPSPEITEDDVHDLDVRSLQQTRRTTNSELTD